MRRLIGAITSLVLVCVALVAVQSPAMAEPNADIVVTGDLSWDGDGQVEKGDRLVFAGTWDATNADPEPGDTFHIGLPEELGFDQAIPFDLQGQNGHGDPVIWGRCLTDPVAGVVECELSDEVANWDEIHGTFELEVTAQQVTTETALDFDFNGQGAWVEVPGDGGIGDGIEIDDEVTKNGWMRHNRWQIDWQIEIPGSLLASSDQEVVQVLETLSENHELCENPGLRVETVRGGDVNDVSHIAAINEDVEGYDFAFELTEPDGGFNTDVTYRISFATCTPDKQILPQGTAFTNEAVVEGVATGEIGVEQDWVIGDAHKSGSVHGGELRNGEIEWTVDVPGDALVTKESFTLVDELSGEHALCLDENGDHHVQGLEGSSCTARVGESRSTSTWTRTSCRPFPSWTDRTSRSSSPSPATPTSSSSAAITTT